ncbi:multidrug efflux SMR transporter [Ferruginibacter sp. HRS2-29]|uniref:DMT family transporter n=1 Tax=Ferruginibacter sp. HRS2-29 TaxID=2487334 RepID=UPI0020CBC681|nr:multidrug efflux SMR transporter [Ferruginibacter sp. HRS2-29]MCP9752223.1 QacE family quaternary ammonium compound efflux SMR transporter [Ferruginibacter sp. HRS2-29]
MGYLFLALTILCESIAIIFMKLSHGFEQKFYAAIALAGFSLCYVFLTLALKHLPAGLANATWAGCSTILIAVLGVFILKENINTVQYFFLAMIIVGLVGFNYYQKVDG